MEVTKVDFTSGEMLTEKVEITWRIENFEVVRKSEECLGRQKLRFSAGSKIGLTSDWICFLEESSTTPEGTVTKKKIGYLRIHMERAPAGVKELMASCKLTMKGVTYTDNSTLNVVKDLGWKISNAYDWSLINGCLAIEAELTLMKMKDLIPYPEQSLQQIEALFKPRFTEKMQQEFAKLLEGSNEQSDAIIVSKDDAKFPVTRCILSERSPVFEKMFKTPMIEAHSGIVAIPDLSSKTVAVLLRYVYTGTLHQDWSEEQVLPELVYAANKYGVQDLVDFLDQAVGHVCTKENAGRLFSLLGKLGMKTGEREVHNFIKRHTLSFEDMASFVEEATQDPEQLDVKSEKGNVLRSLRNSWRMVIGRPSRKSSSQKTKGKALSTENDP